MFSIIIAAVIIFISIVIFFFSTRKSPSSSKAETPKTETLNPKSERQETPAYSPKPKPDNSKYLLKTIKEGKSLTHCYIYSNGQFILFCDEKKLSLCYNPSLCLPCHKIFSKNIDLDLIKDVTYCPKKKLVICASKNSKNILYYSLVKNSDTNFKPKLVKLEDKKINTNRPYEISSIVISSDGNLISTIGTNDDTEIQVFDTETQKMIFNQATGAINNFQILMGYKDKNLLISTYMNDISVVNFDKTEKFNKETKTYENSFKIKRGPSISGIKNKIVFYCLSNSEEFLAVSGEDNQIKILRNYGNISESKIFSTIKLDYNAEVITMYVDDFQGGKLSGYIAASKGNDVFIYDVSNGEKVLELLEAHEADIVQLGFVNGEIEKVEDEKKKFVEVDKWEIENYEKELKENKGKVCLISAGKDGKIKFWKLEE